MKRESIILAPNGKPVNYLTLYEATIPSRHRAPLWPQDTDSKDSLDPWTRTELLTAARTLYANVGFVKGVILSVAVGYLKASRRPSPPAKLMKAFGPIGATLRTLTANGPGPTCYGCKVSASMLMATLAGFT